MRSVVSLGSFGSRRSLGWLGSLGPALLLFGCWSASDNALFAPTDGAGASGAVGAGATSGAQSGTGSSGFPDSGVAGSTVAGSGGAGSSSAGAALDGGGELEGGATSVGSGGRPAQTPQLESCDMLDGAVTSELNQHCYRVSLENLDFAAALAGCRDAGGHLVAIGDQAENDFVHDLHDGEHWLGASDGRSNATSGVGPYSWVDQEPWQYSAWEDGQPNAHETDCPGQDGGAECFEHCAFQSDSGDWNDRSCWHTIASVCEWDLGG